MFCFSHKVSQSIEPFCCASPRSNRVAQNGRGRLRPVRVCLYPWICHEAPSQSGEFTKKNKLFLQILTLKKKKKEILNRSVFSAHAVRRKAIGTNKLRVCKVWCVSFKENKKREYSYEPGHPGSCLLFVLTSRQPCSAEWLTPAPFFQDSQIHWEGNSYFINLFIHLLLFIHILYNEVTSLAVLTVSWNLQAPAAKRLSERVLAK